MRNPLAPEVSNEELCSLLKRKIKDSVYQRDDLFIKFHYQGEVTLQDSEKILARIAAVHAQVLAAVPSAQREERQQALQLFADSLSKAFY